MHMDKRQPFVYKEEDTSETTHHSDMTFLRAIKDTVWFLKVVKQTGEIVVWQTRMTKAEMCMY